MSKKNLRGALLTALAVTAALAAPLLASGTANAASVSTWEKVAQCESGGNWSINTGNGYYGGLQFSLSTWDAYGGQQYAAYPNQATEEQQILIGQNVLAAQGQDAWPTCGPAAGLGADTATPVFSSAPVTDPGQLASGTLVKSPDSATVKVIIAGAGLPLAASDVSADGYDLSKIVTVTDASFNALPSAPPAGTVVLDQSGTSASRYVVIDGAALPITGAEWTADGYNTRPAMGVPTSWLQRATAATLPSGTVVLDQAGTSASRYVMIGGAALPITGAEWTADGYNTRPAMGVPGTWLASAIANTIPNGTVIYDQAGTSASRYVMQNGTAVLITAAQWTADGYNKDPQLGVPGTWLASVTAPASSS
jgi:hypothetical protein